METLGYLHIALAHETPADIALCERLDWQKFSSKAWMYLLPVIISIGVLGRASETIAQTLKRGISDPQVRVLQEDLQQLNYFNGPITGFFGSQTEAALKAFQQANGLPPDGIYGPDTEAALQEALFGRRSITLNQEFHSGRFTRTLQLGASGSDVSLLQELLTDKNFYFGPINGFFGSQTEAAVRQFQLESGLEVDGIAGSTTLAALERGDRRFLESRRESREATLEQGSFGSRVRELQERLRSAGFYTGSIDGYYGTETAQAVRDLQRANNLAITGIANRDTLVALLTYRYVVVVPNQSSDTLFKVRRSVFDAFPANSRLGAYVNAGVFNNRALAESRSQFLRSRGLDARVVYQ